MQNMLVTTSNYLEAITFRAPRYTCNKYVIFSINAGVGGPVNASDGIQEDTNLTAQLRPEAHTGRIQ